jgi:hypothetical protein
MKKCLIGILTSAEKMRKQQAINIIQLLRTAIKIFHNSTINLNKISNRIIQIKTEKIMFQKY